MVYDSLQLAHKCILNSFYGYVMRKYISYTLNYFIKDILTEYQVPLKPQKFQTYFDVESIRGSVNIIKVIFYKIRYNRM